MYTTIVYVEVKPDKIQLFKEATQENHNASVNEKGNCRFDILQQKEDPSKFILYEAYENEDAAAEHKNTSHYLNWRETVADWMQVPRKGVSYTGLYPELV